MDARQWHEMVLALENALIKTEVELIVVSERIEDPALAETVREWAAEARAQVMAAQRQRDTDRCPWKPCGYSLCAEFGRRDCDSHDEAEAREARERAEARGGAS